MRSSAVVGPPPELDRLTLDGRSIARWNSAVTGRRHPRPEAVHFLEQRPEAKRGERVAGVERDRHAVRHVHRRATTTRRGCRLRCRRGSGRRCGAAPRRRQPAARRRPAAEGLARREAQRGPKPFALAHRVGPQRVVQVALRLASGRVRADQRHGGGAIAASWSSTATAGAPSLRHPYPHPHRGVGVVAREDQPVVGADGRPHRDLD